MTIVYIKIIFKFVCYVHVLYCCFSVPMTTNNNNNNCNMWRLIKNKIQLFVLRKSIYTGTHNFIHFNLSLSLVIGLIIFVSAVETVKDNEVTFLIIMAEIKCSYTYVYVHFCLGGMHSSCCSSALFLLDCICVDVV